MTAAPWGCTYNGKVQSCCTNLGFMVRRGANQQIIDSTETVIDFGTIIEENPTGTFDLVLDQFVVTIPGRYMFSCSIDMTFSANGYGEVRLYENATLRSDERAESDLETQIKIGASFTKQLGVGDVIEARVYQVSGVNAVLNGNDNQFSGALICTP